MHDAHTTRAHPKLGRRAAAAAVTLATAALVAAPASAIDWADTAPGEWSDFTNWNPQSVPNGVGVDATILSTVEGGPLALGGTFLLTEPITLGSLYMDMGFAGPTVNLFGDVITFDNGGGADVFITTDATGGLDIGASIVLMGTLVSDWRASNGQISGTISGNYGILHNPGPGISRIRLYGNNTYTGETIVRKGTLSILNATGLGDHAVGTTVEADGTLIMEAPGEPTILGEHVTLENGGLILMRPADWAEEITLDNFGGIAPWFDGYTITVSGKLTGDTFVRESAQSRSGDETIETILHLTNIDNDYTGGTIIDSGMLGISDDRQLGALGTDITFNQDGFWEGPPALLTTADVTIDRDLVMIDDGWLRAEPGTTGTYPGVISGIRPLDIGYLAFTGTVALAGNNTYTGDTTVNTGTLLVNNAIGSGTGSGNVTVSDTATLGGTGTIAGDITANAGASVAPGASAGALAANAVTFDATSSFDIEVGGPDTGEFDQLNITTTATLDGTLNVTLINGYTPADGASFDILTAATVSGTFAVENLPVGFSVEYLPGIVRLHVSAAAPCMGDTNGDNVVNADDFLNLLGAWGTCPDPCPPSCAADFNGDCMVDADDFLALLGAWGACPAP